MAYHRSFPPIGLGEAAALACSEYEHETCSPVEEYILVSPEVAEAYWEKIHYSLAGYKVH
jgi:hypothetical protein